MFQQRPFIYHKPVRDNTPGHVHFYTFSCFQRLPLLTNELWREWLATSITHARNKLEVDLWAYVFMPEHVHLLLHPRRDTYRISEFIQLIKFPVARRVLNSLKKCKSPLLDKLRIKNREGSMEFRFWQAGGGHDINIVSMKKAIEKAEYCHNNPVKRGLVQSAEKFKWSSYRWLINGSREDEPLVLNDWVDG